MPSFFIRKRVVDGVKIQNLCSALLAFDDAMRFLFSNRNEVAGVPALPK